MSGKPPLLSTWERTWHWIQGNPISSWIWCALQQLVSLNTPTQQGGLGKGGKKKKSLRIGKQWSKRNFPFFFFKKKVSLKKENGNEITTALHIKNFWLCQFAQGIGWPCYKNWSSRPPGMWSPCAFHCFIKTHPWASVPLARQVPLTYEHRKSSIKPASSVL